MYFVLIVEAASNAGVPVALFDALLAQESRYCLFARSPAGAMGLAQLMPGTARYLGVRKPWDADENLRGGARYLREQRDRFGSWDLAFAAYNAGPGRIARYRGIPPFRETRDYVRTIMGTLGSSSSAVPTAQRFRPFRRVLTASFERPSQVPEN